MYKDMYNVFDNVDIPYHDCPEDFEHFIHLRKRKVTKIKWFYGDTLTLKFDLKEVTSNCQSCNIEVTPEYLQDKQVVFDFYNFRHEVVWEKPFVPNEININEEEEVYTIELVIDRETSEKCFKKGIYSGSVKIQDNVDNKDRNTITVLDASKFIIYVE